MLRLSVWIFQDLPFLAAFFFMDFAFLAASLIACTFSLSAFFFADSAFLIAFFFFADSAFLIALFFADSAFFLADFALLSVVFFRVVLLEGEAYLEGAASSGSRAGLLSSSTSHKCHLQLPHDGLQPHLPHP